MKETLTAKEWLDENHLFKTFIPDDIWIERMEKYANYKTKELKDKILEFNSKFKHKYENILCDGQNTYIAEKVIQFIEEHFNIKEIKI